MPSEYIMVIASQGKIPRALPHPRRPPALTPNLLCLLTADWPPLWTGMMGEFRLCSVTESCSLSSREGGSAHEVQVERESVSRAQGTGLGAWDLGTHLEKVEVRVSSLSMPSVPTPASHLTYLPKHRFQHKTRASRGSSTRAPNPHRGPLQRGL